MRRQVDPREEGRIPEPDGRCEQEGRVSDPPLQAEEEAWVSSPPVQLFRCLKKTAIVLMLLFRLDKPVGESEIAEILDLHTETTRTYLRPLARLGLVTRTHRYYGWMLTVGGRQMILGEADHGWPILKAGKIKTSAENPRSLPGSSTARAEVSPGKVKLPRSVTDSPAARAEVSPGKVKLPRSTAEKPRSSAEIPRSRPIAAASLSLSFKAESNKAAAAIAKARAEVSTGKVRVWLSLVSRGFQLSKKKERTARGRPRSDPVVQANLEALSSIGVMRNEFVLEICGMDHVTPDYILGQKKRLEAERRYSHGLLLTVVRSKDYLPERYLPRESRDLQLQLFEAKMEPEDEVERIPAIEPDPSIHEPLLDRGMTAARAWSAVVAQLKVDMPKAGYDKWVRDTMLLSAREGVFVVGARDGFARDWLESRLASTVRRQLAGICNWCVEVRFVDLNAPGYS